MFLAYLLAQCASEISNLEVIHARQEAFKKIIDSRLACGWQTLSYKLISKHP